VVADVSVTAKRPTLATSIGRFASQRYSGGVLRVT
jgi:hypothetical protein